MALIRREGAALLFVAGLALAAVAPAAIGSEVEEPDRPNAVAPGDAIGTRVDLKTLVVKGRGQAESPSDAELRDLRQVALDADRPLEDVMRSNEGSIELSLLAARIQEREPGLFVAVGMAPTAMDYSAYIVLTDEPSRELIADVRELPIDVQIRYGAPISEGLLDDLSGAAVGAAMEGGAIHAQSSIDWETFGIDVEYAVASDGSTDEGRVREKILAAVRQVWVEKNPKDGAVQPPITVTRNDDISSAQLETAVQGGRNLRLPSGTPECTSGFGAIRNGNAGLVTAGHCANNVIYQTSSGVITFGAVAGNNTDVQFHRVLAGHSSTAKFQAAGGDVRTVASVANPPFASAICNYGVSTHYKCSIVYDTGLCMASSTGKRCGLTVTADYVTSGGDSGGPWFYSFTARGIHSGMVFHDGKNRSALTQIARVANQLNATVKTG